MSRVYDDETIFGSHGDGSGDGSGSGYGTGYGYGIGEFSMKFNRGEFDDFGSGTSDGCGEEFCYGYGYNVILHNEDGNGFDNGTDPVYGVPDEFFTLHTTPVRKALRSIVQSNYFIW